MLKTVASVMVRVIVFFAVGLIANGFHPQACCADGLVFRYYFDGLIENAKKDDKPIPAKAVASRLMTVTWPDFMQPEIAAKIIELYSKDPTELRPDAIAYYASWIETLPSMFVDEAERQLAASEKSDRMYLLRALLHAKTVKPESLAIIREIAGGTDMVLAAPATALWYRHDSNGAKNRVRELLESERANTVVQMCHALSALPVEDVKAFSDDIDRLMQSSELQVQISASRAILRYDPVNAAALTCVAKALREPDTSRICIGYYYPSQNGMPIRWYAASVMKRVVSFAKVYSSETEN